MRVPLEPHDVALRSLRCVYLVHVSTGQKIFVQRGTREFRIINLAFFVAGFVTFVTLYDVQPLFPIFTREFHIGAAAASLVLSVSTGSLAVSMLLVGTLSESLGRKPVMVLSLLFTSSLALLTAFTHSFLSLLGLRLLQGIVLAGLPAVAMAYLGEEMDPKSLSAAMGLYIAGNAVGGMTGRIFTVSMTDVFQWRAVMAIIGGGCLLLSLYFLWRLPPSRNFRRRSFDIRSLAGSLVRQLGNPALVCLYTIAFLAMGGFVTTYNYITFRLLGPPYDFSRAVVGWIFAVYLFGSYCSALAGRMAGRYGRGKVVFVSLVSLTVGALLTLLPWVVGIVIGVVLVTGGFYGTHSVASGWVPARATDARGQASAVYLFAYYLGSSVCGTVGGLFWTRIGWPGVVAFIVALAVLALAVLWRLSALPSPAEAASRRGE